MGTYHIAAVLFCLLANPQAGRAGVPMDGAGQLVRTVDAALADAAQAARDPKQGLDPRNPKNVPFWSALQALRTRVSRIEASLAQPGSEFFLLVDQGSSDLGELRVAWARTGAKSSQVAERLRTASTSYRLLRSGYGREGVRGRQGGGLSEAERQQLARLQETERRFAASAQRLRDQARRRDAATAAELERFRAEAERVAQASADLASYLNALIAASEIRGEWHANVPYIRKTAPPAELAAADATVQDLYVDADIGHVFTVDLGKTEEAAADEGATPARVQILQPGEGQEETVLVEPVPPSTEEAAEPADAGDGETAGEAAAVSEPIPEAGEAEAPATAEPQPAAAKGDGPPQAAAAPEKDAQKDAPETSSPPVPPIPPPIG